MKLSKNKLAIKLYGVMLSIANWLQQLPNKVTPPPFRLVQIGSAVWQSRAIYVAAKLGIAVELGNDLKDTATLAQRLDLNEDHLYRLMRMLASLGIFTELSHRSFKNSRLSEYLLQDKPDNVRAMVLMHNSPEMITPWIESLEESIRDGNIPFEKIHGATLFEYMDQNKEFDTLFSQAMDSVEQVAGTDFLHDLNWSQFSRLIDVGGSEGAKTISILQNNPELKAIVYDRPQVIQGARKKWSGNVSGTVLERIEFIAGDMFNSIPQAESDLDVFLFIAVFHSFDDMQCKTILTNLKKASGNYSPYVVIADTVAEEINTDPTIASMDMQMLMGTTGRERTFSEWSHLLTESGFKIENVMDTRSFAKYIVLRNK